MKQKYLDHINYIKGLDYNEVMKKAMDTFIEEECSEDDSEYLQYHLNARPVFAFPTKEYMVELDDCRFVSGYYSDGCLIDDHSFQYVEEQLFGINFLEFCPQTMEGYSGLMLHLAGSKAEEKEIIEFVSTVIGEFFSKRGETFTKLSTVDCVNRLVAEYKADKNIKRTAKYKFGVLDVRVFNDYYTIVSYGNTIISTSDFTFEE